MAGQTKTTDIKHRFRRSWKLALALSLSLGSMVLFLIYQYDRGLYDRMSFWEIRVPAFVLVFGITFAVLWWRGRHRETASIGVGRR